ncbi:Outer membrane protein and related peptidoglycan-associated (lipo)proteins [Marivirga sericea]|uniref:Outer membrane protein and related peptidoglycan-associated (Lipo)proteins n=1 Tax=Marivirga sericea TaxID=1028 RepID=A0A1X7IAG6_9BACT|nr:OmpA family protein [Marivirga sericea]SMG11014.1 Outer membrane protein and related peptidoglycan-associated (lipo)proteins [Marivirga sericea]
MRESLIVLLAILSVKFAVGQSEVPKSLGSNVNSSYQETKPVISPDGNTLYFARQNYPENYSGSNDPQDIYVSQRLNGNWSAARNIGEPLNDKYPNGVSSVTPDGNTLLIINAYNEYGDVLDGASISHRKGGRWQYPQMINIQEFYNLNEYIDYYLANNERTLLLAIETEESFGDQDLYVSFRIDERNWSKPVNLGRQINSNSPEFSPFLAADNKTLFFASYGHGGYGDADIFYSKRLDDSWQNWSKPENLGTEVNTKEFEAYYTIDAGGENAYFVTTKGSVANSKDIYQMNLPYKFRPDPVLLLKGEVVNISNGSKLEADIEFVNTTNYQKNEDVASNTENGFLHILEQGALYQYLPVKKGYVGILQYQDLTKLGEYLEKEQQLGMVPIAVGSQIPVHHITFVNNADIFRSDAYFELDRFASLLQSNPQMQIEIIGHTSQLPLEAENERLSYNRAQLVAEYFEKKNIHPDRLRIKGAGEKISFSSNGDVALKNGIALEDRITIKIISMNWEKPKPKDSDEDGIIDIEDDCPTLAGVFENNGCPEITEETKEVLKEALEGIEFELASDVIRSQSLPILDKVVTVMEENPDYKLKISGHTDNQGDDDANLLLSHKRAQATKKYLMDQGIAILRLDAVGYGEMQPIESNDTADGRAKNRRVEFEIVFF